MDEAAVIAHLARSESRNLVPRRLQADLDEVDGTIPLFRIEKTSLASSCKSSPGSRGGYRCQFVKGLGTHYTASYRAPFFVQFFENEVLPAIDPEVDASGLYHFELHDSASTEAVATTDGHGTMTFGKDLATRGAGRGKALVPDLYQAARYNRGPQVPGILELADEIPFERKKDKVFFAGATTGSLEPLQNQRVRAARWAYEVDPLRDKYELYLTSFVQMDKNDFVGNVPEYDKLFVPHVPEERHFDYKYLLNVKGNTACWSRVPLILNSKSLMLNLQDGHGCWYYPMLRSGVHYLSLDSIEQLPGVVSFCQANPQMCKTIVANANRFVKQYCTFDAAVQYSKHFLEEVADRV